MRLQWPSPSRASRCSVLRSPRAMQVNIAIMRAFVRLRAMLMSNADLARKLLALENKYDAQFKIVFDAIRELMEGPLSPKSRGSDSIPPNLRRGQTDIALPLRFFELIRPELSR